MRILHVVPSYLPAWRYGGPIKSVHGLCRGLASIGHDVHVYTTNVDGPQHLDVPLGEPVSIDGVKVWYFPSTRLKRLYWSPAMRRALKSQMQTFDVIHLHSIFLWPTTAAAAIARRAGVPYVLAPRGMLVRRLIEAKSRFVKRLWIALFERTNLANAAFVHFTSRLEEQDAAELGLSFRSTCVVPNGLDDAELSHDSELPASLPPNVCGQTPFVLFVGRVNWKKGLDRLIRALIHTRNCRLLVAGNDEEGYRPELERIANESGVLDRIVFLGPIYGAQKAALLKRASLLVLPSYSENFGNVVLEAMAAGCPVVVTPEVGAAEIVAETGSGLVLDGAPDILGPGIEALLAQPEKLKEMGAHARNAVTARYTWNAIASEMERVYRRAVSRPSGAALDSRVLS